MTTDQLAELRKRLSRGEGGTDWRMFSEFHHGDCVGADEQAHDMMRVLRARYWPLRVDIHIHPPGDHRARAFCDAEMDYRELMSVRVWDEKDYLSRNRDIVDNTDLLIACPNGYDFRSHGGTSYTIRYALRKKKPVVIIWPDGKVEKLKDEGEDEQGAEEGSQGTVQA
jgi:hypothetical protein